MAFQPVPNTAQLELTFIWQDQRVQNVLHYVKATPWSISDIEELADAGALLMDTAGPPVYGPTVEFIECRATDLGSETGAVYTAAPPTSMVGTATGLPLPNNVTTVITKRTALRGRSYRGRLYHIGMTESMVDGNNVTSLWSTAFLTFWNLWLSLSITADEALLCVVSRKNGGVDRIEGVATLVTNLTTDGVIDSQRRRLPGRGQ